ncbi:recombinase family protein [Actinomadura sp. SCN-SB]|uniref:recombinase family protein n=1 Tax=Actinomadura sp. SCN-SB TaxID=3373092 RepID=UPI00375155B6
MTREDDGAKGDGMDTRAVIYVRISRDKAGAGLGVAEQERQCRELAERLGYTVIAVYVDNDMSAYTGKPRPDYRRMLRALSAGKAERVLAWHTDRLHRSNTELEDYIKVVEPRGILTETVKAGPVDLATPTGRMVARQLCAIARYESEHRAERVSLARERQARQGKYGGGKRPYGFEADGVTVIADEAREIARMAHAFLSGVGLHSIAADLRAREVPTTDGRRWQTSTVRAVLLRPRNAALMAHRPKNSTSKRPRGVYGDDEIVGVAPWDPIISPDTWRAVVAKLTDPNRTTTPGPAPAWLGSGIYRCPCGGVMRGSNATGNNRYPTYRCQERGKGHVRIAAGDIDAYVRLVVIERLSRADAAELISKPSSGPTLAELNAQLAVHHQRLQEIADDREADRITRAQAIRQTEQRRAKIAKVEEQIAAATDTSPLVPLINADDVARVWDGFTLGEKRAALRALMTITIQPVGSGRRNVPASARVTFGRPTPTPSPDTQAA